MARPIYGCLLFLSGARGTFFLRQGESKRRKKNFSVSLSAMDALLISCFLSLASKGQRQRRGYTQSSTKENSHLYLLLLSYAQINSVAHVYRLETCNRNLCAVPFLCAVMTTVHVCMNVCFRGSMLCLTICLFVQTRVLFPASSSPGSSEGQLPTVHIKISCLICRHGKSLL